MVLFKRHAKIGLHSDAKVNMYEFSLFSRPRHETLRRPRKYGVMKRAFLSRNRIARTGRVEEVAEAASSVMDRRRQDVVASEVACFDA
jgi:hypothetical protein